MKYQEEVVNNASIYAATLFKIIDLVETKLAESYDIDELLFDENDIGYTIFDNIHSRDSISIRIYNIDEYLIDESWEISLEDAGITVKIIPSGPGYYGVPYRQLFPLATKGIIYLDRFNLRRLATQTTRTGIEYMILYTDRGSSLLLEGDYLRVRIPFVKTAASIHTHPEGSCGLSRQDIESGLDLLVEGGIMEAAATPSCAFAMIREGAISEDDYVAVKLMRGPIFEETRLGSILFKKIYY